MAQVAYSREEVCKLLSLSEAELRGLLSAGLVHPHRGPRRALSFSFQDLVVLRAAKELRTTRLTARRLREALRALRTRLPEGTSLAGLRLEAFGDDLIVREAGSVYAPGSGQLLFDFEADAPVAAAEPGRSRAPAIEEAIACYERGLELEERLPSAARDAYERALALDPEHVEARINLGRLLHEAGELAAAAAAYRQAVAIDSAHAVGWFNLGVALEDAGKLSAAADAYRSAIAADPQQADAHHNLSQILERLGDVPAALRHLAAYRRLSPRH